MLFHSQHQSTVFERLPGRTRRHPLYAASAMAAFGLALSLGACKGESPTATTPTVDAAASGTPTPAPEPAGSFKLTPEPGPDGVLNLQVGDTLEVNMCQSGDPDSLSFTVEWGDDETSSDSCQPEHVYEREGTFTMVASVSNKPSVSDKQTEDQAHATARGSMTATVEVAASNKPDRGPKPKVQLCHKEGNGGYHLIEVNGNAEPAHRAHGDAAPGEPVPGQPGKVFGETCDLLDENAAIDIEKATNGADADAAPGPSLPVGSAVQWTYVVLNTGDSPLEGVAVSDDQGVAVSCPSDVLAVGASMTCTASGTAQSGQYRNVGDVTGTGAAGSAVSDSDPSHYFGGGGTITVSVAKDGTGTGRVTSSPAGVDCGSTCSATFGVTQSIRLEARADPASVFGGWGGDADCVDAVLTPNADKSCVATFDLEPPVSTNTITVTKDGTGSGRVESVPAGINCGSSCSAAFPDNERVELTQTAAAGSTFVGWGGDADCSDGVVRADADKTCNATFDLLPPPPPLFTLQVTVVPTGSGIVTSSPAAISCQDSCSADFADGTVVGLGGRPGAGSSVAWSGDCTSTGAFTSQVTMDADKSCQATFR